MNSLRILVAERDDVIRQVITALLAQQGWEVCGEASFGSEAIAKLASLKPDIVLLDAALTNPAGLETTRRMVQANSTQRVAMLGISDDESAARQAFEAGALAYVVKVNITRELAAAIKALQEGRTFFTPRVAEKILHGYLQIGEGNETKLPIRSERERVAVKLLAREAATTLHVHPTRPGDMSRAVKYLLMAVVIGVSSWLVWSNYHDIIEEKLPFIDKVLLQTGVKSAPPQEYAGNPNTKVWIDLHTALYYCPGTPLYGKTGKGRFARQEDALNDHFEPATRKACE
jgi:two-component system, NarL family, response regulator NreC